MRVILTGGGSGGHVSPALAVAGALRQEMPDISLLYIGGDLTMEGSTGPSLEAKLVEPTGIPFVAIRSGKLRRGSFGWSTITRLWGVVPGTIAAWRLVRRFKPDVVFSSGGYVSLPVVLVSWLQRAPIVIHEQTAAVGLANAVAGRLATKVAVTFPQSASYFKATKVTVTGNPLQPAIIQPDLVAAAESDLGSWLQQPGLPIIYVTGGGLGSHVINQAVEACLSQLLHSYRVVHQCGSHSGFNDLERLQQLAGQLPAEQQRNYYVQAHFSPTEVGWLYHYVSAVVARAGANTVLEIAACGLPAVFIPIPWVTHDEQTKNAQVLVEAGTAVILAEKDLSPANLQQSIAERIQASVTMISAKQAARALVDPRATDKLVSLVKEAAA